MVRPDLVRRKLRILSGYLRELEVHRNITLEEYLEGGDRLRSIERLLQLIVECAADINIHLATEVGGGAPTNYRNSFRAMVKAGVIDSSLGDRLMPSAGLRNALVHEYGGIDDTRVHASIPLALDGFTNYVQSVVAWVNRFDAAPEGR